MVRYQQSVRQFIRLVFAMQLASGKLQALADLVSYSFLMRI